MNGTLDGSDVLGHAGCDFCGIYRGRLSNSSQKVMETIGWVGSILFAICGLPQAIQCAKDGHARGLNWFFLLAWLGGEVLTIVYVWPTNLVGYLRQNYTTPPKGCQ